MRLVFFISFFFFLTPVNCQELDLSFANTGFISVPNTTAFFDIIILENSQIQTFGSDYTYPDDIQYHHTQLTLFNNDGSMDTDFGDSAYVNLILGDETVPTTMHIQADNKIVVVGIYRAVLYTTPKHTFIARYHQDGSLDTTFAGDGILQYHIVNSQTNDHTLSSIMLNNDQIVCLTHSAGELYFSKINPDGSFDNSFGTDGILQIDLGVDHPYFYLNTLFLLPDEKILATGTHFDTDDNRKLMVVKFNIDGSLDTSFGSVGVCTVDAIPTPGISEFSLKTALQSDGKILVSGEAGTTIFYRLTSDGFLDTTFGDNGIVFAESPNLFPILSIAVQPNDKFISCGTFNPNIVLTKFTKDGAYDTSFGEEGFYYLNINTNNSYGESVKLQEDGKILIGGASRAIGEYGDGAIIRLHNNENIGVTESSVINDFICYPNPTTSQLFINNNNLNIQSIQFYDALGNLVTQKHSNFQQIDVSLLKSGVYMMKIEIESGVIVRKVVKE